MTSLFRPWTEDKSVKSAVDEMTELILTRENSSTMTENPPQMEDSSAREIRYRNVKEHMKKRTEKYLMKKLKVRAEWKEPDNFLKASEASMALYPPVQTHFNPFECPLGACPPNAVGPGGELLDAALAQGFPPSLFEEYARLLTEQQRHVADRNRKQRPKKFRCPHCQVGFSNNGQLKGHIRIHTGERPFKCDAESCGKSFTRNEELTRHRRIHSGLRPFPCPECGKRFGRKDHLKKHVKTHFQQRYQLVPILPSHCPYFYGFS